MTSIQFSVPGGDGESFNREWYLIPRVGEHIEFFGYDRQFVVTRVSWREFAKPVARENPAVQITLKELVGDEG